MDRTGRTRQAALDYADLLERRDWEGLGRALAEDVVYELPQTRERVRGRDRLVRFNVEYPGDWHLSVDRVVADGLRAALWIKFRVGVERMDACVWLEVSAEGLIVQITDFWPEAYQPPAGRDHLVERW